MARTDETSPHRDAGLAADRRRDAVRSLLFFLAALLLAALAWAYQRWTGYGGLWIHAIPWAVALLAGLRGLVQGVRWLRMRRVEGHAQGVVRSQSRR